MINLNRTKNISLRRFYLSNEIVILVIALTLSGCISIHWKDESNIVQHRGFLWYSLIDKEDAHIFQLETLGLQLRFQEEDPGMNIGYRKFITLKSTTGTSKNYTITSGIFRAEHFTSKGVSFQFKKQLGLEIGGAPLANGLSIGYDHITVVKGPPNGDSVVCKIDFYENNFRSTRFFQSTNGVQE